MVTTAIPQPPAIKGITIPHQLQADAEALSAAATAHDADYAGLAQGREQAIANLLDSTDDTNAADLSNGKLRILKARVSLLSRAESLATDYATVIAKLSADARGALTEAQAAAEEELHAMGWSAECMPAWKFNRGAGRDEFRKYVLGTHPQVVAALATVTSHSKAGRRIEEWQSAIAGVQAQAREELRAVADGLVPSV